MRQLEELYEGWILYITQYQTPDHPKCASPCSGKRSVVHCVAHSCLILLQYTFLWMENCHILRTPQKEDEAGQRGNNFIVHWYL